MSRKRELTMLLMISAMLVTISTSMAMIQPASCENEETVYKFKLLVVENVDDQQKRTGFVDGQHLIKALLDFAPWNNTDDNAMIHLLSYNRSHKNTYP